MLPALALLPLAFPGVVRAGDGPEIVQVGHWVEVRGEFDERGTFVATDAEILPPEELESLSGTIELHAHERDVFVLLGQPVYVSERTKFRDLDAGQIAGTRVKVEGRWRGPRKLSARVIKPRSAAGRDGFAGRVDAVRPADGGIEVSIMRFTVFLSADLEVTHERALQQIELAPEKPRGQPFRDDVSEDDLFGAGIGITDSLRFTGVVTTRSLLEDDYNLDETDPEDRQDYDLSIRARLVWQPSPDFAAVAEARHRVRYRDDEKDGSSTLSRTVLGENYIYWRNIANRGVDLQLGRQDFDDRREWIYDQDLDAVRLITRRPNLRLETSISTTLSDGSPRDEASTNVIGYLSNEDRRNHLAAWAIYRDIDREEQEELFFGGIRAIGRWIPDNRSWFELAAVDGEVGSTDVLGWGYDIGTTWSPDFAEPLSFTLGYAYGRGDDDPTPERDTSFRQTGFQDNNAKFAGVTSFLYYGELVDPELSNLGILTAGIGARVAERTSLDLVVHHYLQDVAQPFLVDSDLDERPNGIDPEIGWEVDLVFGCRRWERVDLEIVGAWFRPGDAFPGADDAYLGKIQLRFRL